MKEFWLEKKQCTGCGACADACPKKAIRMEADDCGFIYPVIGESCVDCGLCEKTCAARGGHAKLHREEPNTYAAWTKQADIRYNSTSGGVFSELANVVLDRGGVVAGARYREDNMVEHTIVADRDGLAKIRQSKYIQSDPNGIYADVKKALADGKEVLYCGAPCQVAALYAYLGREYDNLTTADFICRGMNSPKAYREWLSEIEKNEGSRAKRVWFKYKDGGWKTSPRRTRIDFEDGHHVVFEGANNLFMHGYLTSNLYIRPSCGDCRFKGVPRQGDLTLADFWKVDPALDDDGGTSMVLVNSEKGDALFEEAKASLTCYPRDFAEIFAGNVCFSQSVRVPEKSEAFLRTLGTRPFSDVIREYTKVSFFRRVKRKIAKMLGRK